MSDSNGMTAYTCPSCKRDLWYATEYTDAMRRRNAKLRCLPCDYPDRYRWELDAVGDEVTVPISKRNRFGEVKPVKRDLLPGDIEAIQLKQMELDLSGYMSQDRMLEHAIIKLQEKRDEGQKRIVELTKEKPDLEKIVREAFADPNRLAKHEVDKLRAKIKELTEELEKGDAEHE